MNAVFRTCVAVSLLSLCFPLPGASQAQQPHPSNRTIQTPSAVRQSELPVTPSFPPGLVESGRTLFAQDCAFCHGRDAAGGESGPDLTRSHLVATDVGGSTIAPVIHNGRPQKGMPPFNLSDVQIASLVAFIHTQMARAEMNKGGRRGVDVSDLQTGNPQAGRQYFNGAGKCSSCHSPTGDLAGIASRYQGLELERRMLYPPNARSTATVTLSSGQTVTGTLAYLDEFTIAIRDPNGYYRSWPVSAVKYAIDSPVDAHVQLLAKYTDDDVHNLMAYLQTLR